VIVPSHSIGFSDALMKGVVEEVVALMGVGFQKICDLEDQICCHDFQPLVADVLRDVFDAILMQRLEMANQISFVSDLVLLVDRYQ
jgi:hypothetical protein